MADTEAFHDVADIVDLLDMEGYEVIRDTHIHEDRVNGEEQLVVDFSVIVGE